MTHVTKRVVLHFPGFEPLNAEAHRARYERSAKQSASVWDFTVQTGQLREKHGAAYFDVEAGGTDWQTSSRVYVFDHDALVEKLNAKPLGHRLLSGFCSAFRVVLYGGLTGYFRHAWRFGLFFIFPFLFVGLALVLSLCIAASPLWLGLAPMHLLWSVPLAFAFFRFGFIPFSGRLHTLHLFADWELAVAMARLNRPDFNQWLGACADGVRVALQEDADEFVITSHSMGSNIAAHVVGMLLERDADAFEGKRVVFATLGGAILQCALLRPARALRARVGLIARTKEIFFLEVHCLTDSIHFYKSRVVAATGHPDAPQAHIAFIRVKQMLSQARYRKIKLDFLRVHRQYVLGPDRRAPFDFTLMTAGPIEAASFADFTTENMPDR